MQAFADRIFVSMHIELAVFRFHLAAGYLGDRAFVSDAIVNQVDDGANLYAVLLCKLLEVWTPGHGAIFVHDFDDCGGGQVTG